MDEGELGMSVLIDQLEKVLPGEDVWVGSEATHGKFAVVFEGDDETGYFYASNALDGEVEIFDALHIYDVRELEGNEVEIKIGWSTSGYQAVLFLEQQPVAVFDFVGKKGWCVNCFPPEGSNGWSGDGHQWSDEAMQFFQ
jgi:hypothetical protein